ncbi:MAG: DUF4430 domain-containing protein [Patescibacteria group bacterium]
MLNNGKLKLSIFVLFSFVIGMVFIVQVNKTNDEIDKLAFKPVVIQNSGEVAGVFTVSPLVDFVINNGQDTQQIGFEVTEPVTILSLLEKGSQDHDLSYSAKEYDFGTLLEELNGYVNGTDGKYWTYSVNGKEAMVGVDAYQVSGGDTVEFKFAKM